MDELTEQLIQRLLAAVTRSSDDDARRLIADARAEAEAEVKDLLKSAVKAVLLRQAVSELERAPGGPAAAGPAPSPTPPVAPAAAEADEATACYVYGIARAGAADLPQGLVGVDGEAPVSAVRHEDLVAVTSAVRRSAFAQSAIDEHVKDLAWVEQKVHAHDRVVKATMAAGPVIPCRFCTVVADGAEVRRLLRRHAEPIRQALARLDGRREWGVKVVYSPDAAADVAEGDAEDDSGREAAGEGSGRSYLLHKRRRGARRSDALREAQAAADECHRVLSTVAAEAALLPTRDRGDEGRLLLNGAYLVADADAEAFDAALAELRARHEMEGLSLERTGPWPPYNFARLSLTLEPEPPRESAAPSGATPEAAA
jgi:hypothetical protein